MPQALPARPSLAWLKKTAKQRLAALRTTEPDARLHQAQFLVARDHGFRSWRELREHLEICAAALPDRRAVFEAARAGDADAVSRAIAAGFDPASQDSDGRTIYQIAKESGHAAIELLAREHREARSHSPQEAEALRAIMRAAQAGDADALAVLLDAHPALIDAMGGDRQKATPLHLAVLHNRHAAIRLLIERGAALDRRDFPDNAAPLHFAAYQGDLETIRLLVEAGADVEGRGDDYGIGVLGWATCLRRVRDDVAAYLLDHGANLNLWTAIALDRPTVVREMILADVGLLGARMSRNHHRRTPLHHAAATDRARIVQLLLELGADPKARDAAGATALTTASQENAGPAVIDTLLAAGAPLDFLTAVNLGRFDAAEAMLRADPARIGPDGADTIALHLAVGRRNIPSIRWLIAHGVAINAKRMLYDCNHTALHITVEHDSRDIARMLLEAGADPGVRDDKFDATALGWAHYFGRDELASLLKDFGGTN